MRASRSIVLAAPVRTAVGTFGGSLKDVSAPELGAAAIGASVARAGLKRDEIGTSPHPLALLRARCERPRRRRAAQKRDELAAPNVEHGACSRHIPPGVATSGRGYKSVPQV